VFVYTDSLVETFTPVLMKITRHYFHFDFLCKQISPIIRQIEVSKLLAAKLDMKPQQERFIQALKTRIAKISSDIHYIQDSILS